MIRKGRIGWILLVVALLLGVTTQATLMRSTVYAEIREKEQTTEVQIRETAEEDTKQIYDPHNLAQIAKKFRVDPAYLQHVADVEKMFNLEPYELFALIQIESRFVPKTHMDGGSLSYNTTQMKMATAKTAYMAITEYYKKEIPYPTHDLLEKDKYYATLLAGGYLRYLHDTYQDKYESYTAYRYGINGRMSVFKRIGHFQSEYATNVTSAQKSLTQIASAKI